MSRGFQGLLEHLHFSQSFGLENRGELVSRVVSRDLELLVKSISGDSGTLLSRSLPQHL